MGRRKGSRARERSGKNSQNRRKRGGRGGQNIAAFWRQDVEQPRKCKYCREQFWVPEQSRREYCGGNTGDTNRERKLYMYRRAALIEQVYDLLRWRGVLRQWVERMVDAAHDAVLYAVRVLGWWWNEQARKFEWVGGLGKCA